LWYSFDSFYCFRLTFSLVLMRGRDSFCGLFWGRIWDLNSFDQHQGATHREFPIEFHRQSVVKEDDVQVMAEGQTVKHDTYGLGIVTASDQERTAIDFDDHGPKLFVTSIMVAELIGEAPATPPKTKRRRKASTAAKAAKKAAAATAAAAAGHA
jgi:hypothetical protein